MEHKMRENITHYCKLTVSQPGNQSTTETLEEKPQDFFQVTMLNTAR